MLKYSLRTLLIALTTACALMLIARVVSKSVKPSIGYGVRAQFATLPADDSALHTWLEAQPAVVRVYVNRDESAVRVYWIMSQDLTGDPPPPDLRANFSRFGYEGMLSYDGNWVDQ